jgi:hypothetical protein
MDLFRKSISASGVRMTPSSRAAAERMVDDMDMHKEAAALAAISIIARPIMMPLEKGVFVVSQGSHWATEGSARLVKEVGLEKLGRFTQKFYEKAFVDPHLEALIRERGAHHGERFANWIFEKLGGGAVWTAERQTRSVCPFSAHGHTFQSAHDRSSAHFAAWHSPKRDPQVWGDHFNLQDCRLWMRLHFLAAREVGIFDEHPQFADLYVRLIGHFVSVYESTAPPFARESVRWSNDPANVARYNATKSMPDLFNVSLRDALKTLPPDERNYTGSKAHIKVWPYEAGTSQQPE